MTSAENDQTPFQPPTEPVGDTAHATAHDTAHVGAAESPSVFDAPAPTAGFHNDPTVRVPLDPSAQMPTQQLPVQPPIVVQPSSVVIDRQATVKGSGTGKVAWALAAVLGIAAVAFAVLWVGAAGETDDVTSERDALVVDVASLEEQVATAETEMESTQVDLDDTRDDLDAATTEAAELQTQVAELGDQVADLTTQIDELEQRGSGGEREGISEEVALSFGRALSDGAGLPLTDEEATCLGTEMYNEVGFEALLEVGFSTNPAEADLRVLVEGLFRAAETCGLDLDRLN